MLPLKILLVWPKMPPTYCGYEYILPIVGKKSANLPLGILTIPSMLPKEWDLKFVDMNINQIDNYSIMWADMIFISAMQIQKDSFEHVVELCKLFNKPVVAGGPYATNNFENIIGVSHFVLNEGEITLPEFLNDLKSGSPKYIYKTDKKFDITSTPIPRFDLIKLSDYASVSVQFSRGCPFNCEFCNVVQLFGRKIRTKTNDQIIKEFDQLYNYNWMGNVFIVDDNFIGDKRRAKSLLKEIIKWQKKYEYPFSLFTQTSINVSEDDELLGLLREAGFGMLFIGIETPNKDSLSETGKEQNLKINLLESIHKIHSYGIEVDAGLIVGFDNDGEDIFEKQMEFIEKANIVSALVGVLTALPGTRLYERLKKENRLLSDSLGINTHSSGINFIPTMGHNELINGYNNLMRHLYNPKNYFNRCISLLRKLESNKNYSRKFRMIYIWYLIKIVSVQTFSSYGLSYIWYMIRLLSIRPKLFVEGFRMAIQGHHFFKMVRKYEDK